MLGFGIELHFVGKATFLSEKSNYQKMLDGDSYNGVDASLLEMQKLAQRRMVLLDKISTEDVEGFVPRPGP